MDHAYAIILAGGSGERFWPLSTRSRPKQFLSLFKGKPLLALAIERVLMRMAAGQIYVITAERLVARSREAAPMIPPENIIGEPCKRDTAAAVAVACGLVLQRDPSGVACILTADQLIDDPSLFVQTLEECVAMAERHDAIVTMGIKPTFPATGYGYIELGQRLDSPPATPFSHAVRFVEKPDAQTAQRYLDSGHYLWNSGMFIWRVSVMMEELRRQTPGLFTLAEAVSHTEGAELKALLSERYPALVPISIDYAIMEHASCIITAHGSFSWDDVGSWTSLGDHFPPDPSDNVILGKCSLIDSRNNIIVAGDKLVALIGINEMIVAQSDKAILICPKNRAQEVKKLLRKIETDPDGEFYV